MDQAVADGLTVPIKYHPHYKSFTGSGKKSNKLKTITKNVLMMAQQKKD